MEQHEELKEHRSSGGRWEGVMLSLAAGVAVLAVIRPDLYGGLVEGLAAHVTGTSH